MASQILKIPQNFDFGHLSTNTFEALVDWIAGICDAEGLPIYSEVDVCFSQLSNIDGFGISILFSIVDWLRRNETNVVFKNYSNASPALHYLNKCNFFPKDIFETQCTVEDEIPAFLQAWLSYKDAYQWTSITLTNWLASILNLPAASFVDVRMCFNELFNNVNDHSGFDYWYVHISFNPDERKLYAIIVDTGVSIAKTLLPKTADKEKSGYIHFATKEGVSGFSRPNNMGAGLALLKDCVTIAHDGYLFMYSGNGLLEVRRQENSEEGEFDYFVESGFPGLLVFFELNVDRIEFSEGHREDLEW